jgi:hypothetical protein
MFIHKERVVITEDKNETISTDFLTITDVMNKLFIGKLLEIIDKYEECFGIKGYHLVNKVRIKPLDKRFIIEELWRPRGPDDDLPWVYFAGKKPYNFELCVHVGNRKIVGNRYNMTSVSIRINRIFFTFGTEDQKRSRTETFLGLCGEIYSLTKPLCGRCHDEEDKLAISVSLSKRGFFRGFGFAYSTEYGRIEQPHINCPITGIYWANFFGPSCVEFFGRERLLNAPGVVKREDLDGGGMLLYTAPHLLTPNDPIHRANQLALWNYLGLKPKPNLKVIAKYYSSDRFKGALPSYEP